MRLATKLALAPLLSVLMLAAPGCDAGEADGAKADDAKADDAKADDAKADDAKAEEAKADDAKPADEAKPADDAAAGAAPPVVVFVRHKVKNYDEWKTAFDADEGPRKEAGALAHSVFRDAVDENIVMITLPASDIEKTKAMLGNEDMKKKMEAAGVEGPPEVMWLGKPVGGKELAKDAPPPPVNLLVLHDVKDFDAWQKAFDAHADARAEAGFVAWYIGRSLDNENNVGVHMMGTDPDKAKAFVESEDLKAKMAEAGVEGEPKLWFATMVDHKDY